MATAPAGAAASTTSTSVDIDPGTPAAAFFDLDKTIIAGSSTLAFSGPLRERGLIGRRALLRSGYAQLLLMVAGADADFMERLRSRISALCAGWNAEEVRAVIEQSMPEILPSMIYAEATRLIAEHHRLGHQVVVVSASGAEVVGPIAEALGADHAIGTRMRIVEGRYTGEIEFYCYGEGKAEAARAFAAERAYRIEDCFGYSDSITDLPLLEAVGHPSAVNPDRELRRIAARRGWPVLDFVAPIPLRTRVSQRARSLIPPRRPVPGPAEATDQAGTITTGPTKTGTTKTGHTTTPAPAQRAARARPTISALLPLAALAALVALSGFVAGRLGERRMLPSATSEKQAGSRPLNG